MRLKVERCCPKLIDMKLPVILLLAACTACSDVRYPQQRMQGLWRNDFEGSQFCAAPARSCSYVPTEQRKQPLVWLEFAAPLPPKFDASDYGGLYQVEFLGRQTVFDGRYGHAGMFDSDVTVDRMISMREIKD